MGRWGLSRIAVTLAALAVLAPGLPPAAIAAGEHREISARRAKERKVFTDKQIANGFFKVAFGAELEFGSKIERVRKYVRPVRVYVESNARPDRRQDVAKVISDIGA